MERLLAAVSDAALAAGVVLPHTHSGSPGALLCRVARDIGRKIADRPGLVPHFAEPLARVMHLLAPCQAL